MDNTPGNIPRMMEKLIRAFLPLNRIQLNAYATIRTKQLEITQEKAPMIMEFLNHAGKFATVSGFKNRRL
jgi:hypothetical protein